jgi:ankyrin repeat protein
VRIFYRTYGQSGHTPLISAALRGYTEIVQLLLNGVTNTPAIDSVSNTVSSDTTVVSMIFRFVA